MRRWRGPRAAARLLLCAALAVCAGVGRAQDDVPPDEQEFGPVVRAYLGYLRAEQLVTDDRASRREVSTAYVRRNSNRVRALRQMAIRIARETKNDYLPELYAVARDELGTLFETPPRPETFREGEVLNDTFRYLGPVRTGELFYLFARLDTYEQAELLKKHGGQQPEPASRPASAASRPAGTEAQPSKTSESGATQTTDARRAGAQNGATQPADAQHPTPATRPRRVPPPDAEPPSQPKPLR
ncbi:MAG TPA: hypothetical protein VK421_13520 [Pyrinomonadaceae bacterium]|nr:hypothetical protein [Pyrinomonadaceae bacterium]